MLLIKKNRSSIYKKYEKIRENVVNVNCYRKKKTKVRMYERVTIIKNLYTSRVCLYENNVRPHLKVMFILKRNPYRYTFNRRKIRSITSINDISMEKRIQNFNDCHIETE